MTPLFRSRHFLAADVTLTFVAFLLALVLRFGGSEGVDTWLPRYWVLALTLAAATILVFYLNGLYRRVWRYASTPELVAILRSTTLVALIGLALGYASERYLPVEPLSLGVVVIFWLVQTAFVGAVRLSIRVAAERHPLRPGSMASTRSRVLLVGANQWGQALAREMLSEPSGSLLPVGYVDTNVRLIGNYIGRLPVLGSPRELADIISGWQVNEVIIAVPSAPGDLVRDVVSAAERTGCAVRTMPSAAEVLLLGGGSRVLRKVESEDLLRRKPVRVDLDLIRHKIAGRDILVTGAGGSIGAELVRQLAILGPRKLVLYDRSEFGLFQALRRLDDLESRPNVVPILADLLDREKLRQVLTEERPEIVFHAAAYKHVPLMEDHPLEAVTNNVFGTALLFEECSASGVAQCVLVSTDKAVRPLSVMGATKRLGELLVREAPLRGLDTTFTAVRFGNVLNSSGSFVPIFEEQIRAGGPVTLTDPAMRRYVMTITEAVQLVIEASALASSGQLYVLDMGDPVNIVDVARQMIETLNPRAGVEIVYTGVRPGEKLEEELIDPREIRESSGMPGLWRVLDPRVETPRIWRALPDLHAVVKSRDFERTRRLLFMLCDIDTDRSQVASSRHA